METTIFGIRAYQDWDDLKHWETFFNGHRLGSLIELGTGAGAMSAYLFMQCELRGVWFAATFDHRLPLAPLHRMRIPFIRGDVLGDPAIVESAILASHEQSDAPLVIFCDNGNKPQEVELYAPMLRAGDYIAVHDWGTEFLEGDIPPGCRIVMEGAMTVWLVKEDGGTSSCPSTDST